jgi:hypothetical protein
LLHGLKHIAKPDGNLEGFSGQKVKRLLNRERHFANSRMRLPAIDPAPLACDRESHAGPSSRRTAAARGKNGPPSANALVMVPIDKQCISGQP